MATTAESDPPAPSLGSAVVTHFELLHLHITAAVPYGGPDELAVPTAQAPEVPGTALTAPI